MSKAIADLRKDDPRTAVELWKRRVAASPESVAFRYFDKDAWQGMTFNELKSHLASGFDELLPRFCLGMLGLRDHALVLNAHLNCQRVKGRSEASGWNLIAERSC